MAALRTVPGVGPKIEGYLKNIGVRSVGDLKGRDPERLYEKSNRAAGHVQDRCLLYVFWCAVYYADHTRHDPRKLKWWNWM